jgi:predicted RNA-binding Zn ribbon-like protein
MNSVSPVHGAVRDHEHHTSIEDTFDFLNTLELDSGSLVDRVASLDEAVRWLTDHRVSHADLVDAYDRADSSPEAALDRLRSVRDALREIAHAVAEERAAEPSALAEVNRALASRERIELIAEDDGVSIGHSHVGDPLDDALARLADPLVQEIRLGNGDRVRICDNHTCRWLFYDESRSGRRRWCNMATCGNRAKAARHRARRKAGETPPAPEAG